MEYKDEVGALCTIYLDTPRSPEYTQNIGVVLGHYPVGQRLQ